MSNNIKVIKKHSEKFLKDDSLRGALTFARIFQTEDIDQSILLIESYQGKCISDSEYRWIESVLEFYHGNIYVSIEKGLVKNYTEYFRAKGKDAVQVIARHSKEYVHILAKANYLITNYALPSYFIKKEKQVLVFNFTYSPIKAIGYDDFDAPQLTADIQRTLLMSDFLVYPNKYTKQCLKTAFQLDTIFSGKYIEHCYVDYTKKGGAVIRENLSLEEKEVFCFLPSWNEAYHAKNIRRYATNLSNLFDLLDEKLKENQVMYVKMHPLFEGRLQFDHLQNIKPFPIEYQTNEFITCSNCVISDYAGSVFHAMKNDIDVILHFNEDIGKTYLNIDEMPVSISKNNEELLYLINNRKSREQYSKYVNPYFRRERKDTREVVQTIMNHELVSSVSKKKNIVIYVGSLKDDAIVDSLINKVRYSSKTRYHYTILFYQSILQDRISKLEPISNEVTFLPIVGKKAMTIKESVAHYLYYRYDYHTKWVLKCIEDIYERENKRIFSNLEFDELIHFTGVEKHMLQLFMHSKGIKTLYMQPRLLEKKEQVRLTNVQTVYKAYRNYDKVIYASSKDSIGFDKENIYQANNTSNKLVRAKGIHKLLDDPLQTSFLTRASEDSWNEVLRMASETPEANFIVCYEGEYPENTFKNIFLIKKYDYRMLERSSARLIIERGPLMTMDCLEALCAGVPVRAYDLSKKLGFLKYGFGKICANRTELCSLVKDKAVDSNDDCLLKKVIFDIKSIFDNVIKSIVRKVRKLGMKVLKKTAPVYSKIIRKDKKTILFISFHGRGYSDNPKALHEYMLENPEFKDFKFVWAIKGHKKKNIYIPNAKEIEYAGLEYLYYLAKSKYWISNCKLPAYVYKSKKQVYLQTWHGTPLKRLAHDIIVPEDTTFYRSEMSFEEMVATYDNDVAKYNYMISPSAFTTEVFQSAFAINRERLIETGYPRNDCLSNYKTEDSDELKDKYGIPKDKKVILYAPTWRDNSYNLKGYTFKLEVDFSKWKEVLGDEYVVIFKPHYLIVSNFDVNEYKGFVYSIDATEDISSLYIVSDILITDYSSVFFDYAILKRPIYFYMYDLESYRSELRGFYIDIYKDLPGNVFESQTKMLKDIRDQEYDYDCLERFNQRFNNSEDGNASKRVVDIMMERK